MYCSKIYLWQYTTILKGLFGDPGTAEEILAIREALDTGSDIDDSVSVHSVAQSLLGLLENLREPLVPQDLFPRVNILLP